MNHTSIRSLIWLLFLAPFFFLSYGYANHWAATQAVTNSIVFDWEQYIPFIPWTIVPYWSIDLLYGLAFLLCKTPHQVDRLALRLLTVQLIAVVCFIMFPLHYSFTRPATEGVFGAMFNALSSFDQPFNQAPSLHIGILTILWLRYAASTKGGWRILTHVWALLIAVSVLTTYQHHFFDVPTGALAGLIAIWLWSEQRPTPLASLGQVIHLCLATIYCVIALFLATIAYRLNGWALWLFWPALSSFLVALAYLGVDTFQKTQPNCANDILLAPYRLAAKMNAWCWTRKLAPAQQISERVWLGKRHSTWAHTMLDVTAELKPLKHAQTVPMLDLVTPSFQQLQMAVQQLDQLQRQGPVLVCCALGFSRSACVVAAWLMYSKQANNLDHALSLIQQQRPQIKLTTAHRQLLQQMGSIWHLGSHQ